MKFWLPDISLSLFLIDEDYTFTY